MGCSQKKQWLKNCLVTSLSLIFTLIISEASLRIIFPHTPTFGSYSPRYVIDNRPSYVSGITKSDKSMPFSMVPGYKHEFTDLAYHPEPYQITLDKNGFRNIKEGRQFDDVIVGDSVAYGAGVSDAHILSAIFGKKSSVYNLAISGAGPGMYMYMIDKFLKTNKTEKFTILFFLGNDLRNLKAACWDELKDCGPPLSSKIRRKDVSANPDSPSLVLAHPLLKNSYLAHYIYMFLKGGVEEKSLNSSRLKELHAMIAQKAIADIKNYINRNEFIKSNKQNALRILKELSDSNCISAEIELLINNIIDDLDKDKVDDIFNKTNNITKQLIKKNCYPIGKNMQNLTTYTNYFAGFYYESLDSLKKGYNGNVYNYGQLLKMVGIKYSDLNENSEKLAKLILEMKDLRKIEIYSADLQQKLNYKEQDNTCMLPENCDKIDVFFDFLSGIQANNIQIDLYLIPAEYQLKRMARHPEKIHSLTKRAIEKGINCIDLSSEFLKHYSDKNNNALFLDGAHFTKEGNRTVAEWIMQHAN